MLPVVSIAAALADESRARIVLGLALLAEKRIPELCVCQMTEFLALAPSTVSKHLSILKAAGLLDARKQGRWMYYRLPDAAAPAAAAAIAWLREHALQKTSDERKKWDIILGQNPEDLCRRHACGQIGESLKCCSTAAATRPRKPVPKP
jgi:DNA-binding transcriptional ArsR family regulator